MKVILLQDVKGIGKKFEVKEISACNARNFLLENNMAKPGTEAALKEIERMQTARTEEEKGEEKHLAELVRKLRDTSIEFTLKTDKDGSVFGSVGKEAI